MRHIFRRITPYYCLANGTMLFYDFSHESATNTANSIFELSSLYLFRCRKSKIIRCIRVCYPNPVSSRLCAYWRRLLFFIAFAPNEKFKMFRNLFQFYFLLRLNMNRRLRTVMRSPYSWFVAFVSLSYLPAFLFALAFHFFPPLTNTFEYIARKGNS